MQGRGIGSALVGASRRSTRPGRTRSRSSPATRTRRTGGCTSGSATARPTPRCSTSACGWCTWRRRRSRRCRWRRARHVEQVAPGRSRRGFRSCRSWRALGRCTGRVEARVSRLLGGEARDRRTRTYDARVQVAPLGGEARVTGGDPNVRAAGSGRDSAWAQLRNNVGESVRKPLRRNSDSPVRRGIHARAAKDHGPTKIHRWPLERTTRRALDRSARLASCASVSPEEQRRSRRFVCDPSILVGPFRREH